ncbi:uncharacterized protein CLUP02_00665 [Colletotrichum lupini]|uniref:Uncharacterized protein n=1 Tax=Colletotrichum lupini TaxID=145971 RepID=A0A9Q8W7N6_9PEZI|nr:uncharacterized protein CLUP02_00665 [Colletotrichum lupini]UQC74018.1 hypothetical protein CLUP02_00665 [Colletotrichum lupini]
MSSIQILLWRGSGTTANTSELQGHVVHSDSSFPPIPTKTFFGPDQRSKLESRELDVKWKWIHSSKGSGPGPHSRCIQRSQASFQALQLIAFCARVFSGCRCDGLQTETLSSFPNRIDHEETYRDTTHTATPLRSLITNPSSISFITLEPQGKITDNSSHKRLASGKVGSVKHAGSNKRDAVKRDAKMTSSVATSITIDIIVSLELITFCFPLPCLGQTTTTRATSASLPQEYYSQNAAAQPH